MTKNQDYLERLLAEAEFIRKQQEQLSRNINALNEKIKTLQTDQEEAGVEVEAKDQAIDVDVELQQRISEVRQQLSDEPVEEEKQWWLKADFERFVGENLISKIGIIITVLGAGIGVKYAIDHELISPTVRIMLGYLLGFGLLGLALKLRNRYKNYSAVLFSGAMAINYFITFAAFSFYALIPVWLCFVLMVAFTFTSVWAALFYNTEIIAHIGLVGAYAVPFLLGDDPDNIGFFFSYISIINIGILAIAVKKYWRRLYYSSFGLSWLIFTQWCVFAYSPEKHFTLAFTFLIIFFGIFYATNIAYKLRKGEVFDIIDVSLLLVNASLFYGWGYDMINSLEGGSRLLGLFTLGNAIIHGGVTLVFYLRKMADRTLRDFLLGLMLVFLIVVIPVQFDGNWVTVLWIGEALVFFWIGRSRKSALYELSAYPLIYLALFSLMIDWSEELHGYRFKQEDGGVIAFGNVVFLSSLLFTGAMWMINQLAKKYESVIDFKDKMLTSAINVMKWSLPVIFVLGLYYAFRVEIAVYWNQLYVDSFIYGDNGRRIVSSSAYLDHFRIISVLIYSVLFAAGMTYYNIRKLKSQGAGLVNLILNGVVLLVFLVQGLYVLGELGSTVLHLRSASTVESGVLRVCIRYFAIVSVGFLLWITRKYMNWKFKDFNVFTLLDIVTHVVVLWILSSELIGWIDVSNSDKSYKLGISIFWGLYSLFLIVLGIWKSRSYLRYGAMGLFCFTLLKLFFYDIAHLNTISKTIVFLSLGVLLLIISYLYNRYLPRIQKEED
ncbi:DUF2339 domain-containing protein [Puteibacter caeruleilacunae]|nr:DUF2339 domain-containing protein [Puteibacter caeruleilacunae]